MVQARTALQNFLYEDASQQCEDALQTKNLRPEAEANIRCLWAEALENLARFTDAIQAVQMYAEEAKRARFTPALQCQILLRLGAAYGGTADMSLAITYTKQALLIAQRENDAPVAARSHILIGTLYRRLGELWFARDHFNAVLNNTLRHGNKILIAQAHNGIGIVHFLAGNFDTARASFEQAIAALDKTDDPLLRGSIDVNLATIATLQGQMRESVVLFERAIPQLERARNPRLRVNAYSNLGYSLLRLGEMSRAEEVLRQALVQARECEAPLIAASTLETLGDLHFLRGDFDSAKAMLQESIANLRGLRVGFNQAMALLTQGRGLLLAAQPAQAVEAFRESLEICTRMGDPRGRAAAQLGLIEALLALAQVNEARALLEEIKDEVERVNTLNLIGQLREVSGRILLATGQPYEAAHSFLQAISIREITGEPYREGVAQYYLGQAYASSNKLAAAQKAYQAAQTIFQALGTTPMLKQTTTALTALKKAAPVPATALSLNERFISLLARLLDADFSREVFLHELLNILHNELQLTPVLLLQEISSEAFQLLAHRGCNEQQALALSQQLPLQVISTKEASTHRVGSGPNGLWVYLGKRQQPLPDSLLKLLLKQISIGLERNARPQRNTEQSLPHAPENELPTISLPGLVYCSEAMKKVVNQVLSLRSSNITVLLTGETGTGKELVARAIHAYSQRATHPFIPFNCAAAPRELIESQLFGHRRGSFTGATADFPGMIGAAEKGTLFLDEVGELSREMQPKILRFLQNGESQRLGETSPRITDVRVIAATNRNLEEMVEAGDFRADLYYRLNVIQFELPALRERREEIPLLIEHFLARYMEQSQKTDIHITSEVIDLLKQYDWPGNARQLENEIQRLVALVPDRAQISEELVSSHIRNQARLRLVTPFNLPAVQKTLAESIAETEFQIINSTLTRNSGNISKAAIELGLSRHGLRKMLRRHQITPQTKIQSL